MEFERREKDSVGFIGRHYRTIPREISYLFTHPISVFKTTILNNSRSFNQITIDHSTSKDTYLLRKEC